MMAVVISWCSRVALFFFHVGSSVGGGSVLLSTLHLRACEHPNYKLFARRSFPLCVGVCSIYLYPPSLRSTLERMGSPRVRVKLIR